MKFTILSKQKIQYPNFDPPKSRFVVISFRDTGGSWAKIEYLEEIPNCAGILRFSVDDVDSTFIADKYGFRYFTSEDARIILDFVLWIDGLEEVICQCGAGISRSSGCAAALSKIFNGDDDWVFDNRLYLPNRLIYRTILNEYFDNLDEKELRDWRIQGEGESPFEEMFRIDKEELEY